jgi:hypothetical protein
MTVDLVITVAKRVPVIRNQGRWHGRIAEVRMAARIWGRSPGNVTLGCFEAIMVTLLGDLSTRWGWRWRRVVRLWVRTSSNCEGKQQCCHREQFLHDGSSYQAEAAQ